MGRSVEFTAEIEPVSKQRPRVDSRVGRIYVPTETKVFEHAFGWLARKHAPKSPFMHALSVKLVFYIRPMKKLNLGPYPVHKQDVDNLTKAVLDGMNKIMWVDDVQVVDLLVSKRWAQVEAVGPSGPRVYVYVEELV